MNSSHLFQSCVLILSFWPAISSAFLPSSGIAHGLSEITVTSQNLVSRSHRPHRISLMSLQVVADHPMKGEEKRKGSSDDDEEETWIQSSDGGFIPNIKSRIQSIADQKKVSAKKSGVASQKMRQVVDIQQYKTEVADVRNQTVCVRFYAPWCRACKAVEGRFRRLSKEFPDVKFVEVPVTKDNAYLHKGLGIPSLPFGHIYEPSAGLVEERKINKVMFDDFKDLLKTYSDGECPVTYENDGRENHL